MTSFQRIGWFTSGPAKPGALISALTVALVLSGCSADVGRFDMPSFNLNGKSDETGAIPTPSEPLMSDAGVSRDMPKGDRYAGGAYTPPRTGGATRGVDIAALPAAEGAQPPPTYTSRTSEAPRYQPPRTAPRPSPVAAAPGDTIEVQRGDTLYSLARRNNVTVKDLVTANGLANPNIRPGQRLRMPGAAAAVAAPVEPTPAATPRRSLAAAEPSASAPAPDRGDWGGSYTVQSGDSLYRIARQHNVRIADLQSANNITNPRQLKPGAVLRVPGAGGATPTFGEANKATPREEEPAAKPNIASTTQPVVINSEKRVAALPTGRMTDAPASASAADAEPPPASTEESSDAKPVKTVAIAPTKAADAKLRWPSKGKIISGFGQRNDGTQNDGINIAVPQGTDIHAADEGVVAYAGSELKGYGNLVLVRHDNGWVTAYAHADQILVKRGDKVRRGDVIAKAGKSGQVDQPQLHFELRQGSKPVDPIPYLDRL